jgi:hypothetical protein
MILFTLFISINYYFYLKKKLHMGNLLMKQQKHCFDINNLSFIIKNNPTTLYQSHPKIKGIIKGITAEIRK